MKKAALFFMLAVMSGSVLTGCGSGAETKEKTEVTATPKPTKSPKKSETSQKTSTNENKPQETSKGKNNSSANGSVSSEKTEKDTSKTIEEKVESGEVSQGWDSIVLYDIDLNGVQVKRGDDGNWYDENGVSYGNLDNADESQPIINENGDTYYWNGDLAEQAAEEENSDSSSEDSSSTEGISDPFDLYSWDEGTGQYIPFQQAETDASPVGKGNGWYYYDEESNEFLPW
ncbi:hypothetical protein [Blautia sp. XA-2221]|uniref:hypothetical protein n=1 Tax=Blautia sp. XA-2221 TaxID=2903961 RepID=UPI0023783005|nr:hypothetical protein [Blautia sp. XA-2221]